MDNSNIVIAIITAGVTVFVSIVSVLISKHLENRAKIILEIRGKKIPIYEEIISFIFKILEAANTKKDMPNKEEIFTTMLDHHKKMTIWGSDDVIKAYYKYMHSESPNQNSTAIMFNMENLLLAIRKDLGHKNKGLERGKLLGLFTSDIGNYI